MAKSTSLITRPTTQDDRSWIRSHVTEWWKDEMVVLRGKKFILTDLNGFIAEQNGEKIGLVLLRYSDGICEIMSLTTNGSNPKIGLRLIKEALKEAVERSVRKLVVVTTNDNINALRFYQKLGFHLVELRPNILKKSREIKPSIPEIGNYGIPIRDEIELELYL